jgi:hypothetical protein
MLPVRGIHVQIVNIVDPKLDIVEQVQHIVRIQAGI